MASIRHAIPSWKTLKSLANSKFAKLTIIAPVIGWLLIYNDNIIMILEKYYDIEIAEGISWKLHAFYLGLIFISISAIIHIIFCPREISDYLGLKAYIETERKIFTKEYENALSTELKVKPMEWLNPVKAYEREDGSFPLARIYEVNEESIIDRLNKNYETKNYYFPFFRSIIFGSFLIGVILASTPTISTIGWSIVQLSKILST